MLRGQDAENPCIHAEEADDATDGHAVGYNLEKNTPNMRGWFVLFESEG
jgi:hypothetical protein